MAGSTQVKTSSLRTAFGLLWALVSLTSISPSPHHKHSPHTPTLQSQVHGHTQENI